MVSATILVGALTAPAPASASPDAAAAVGASCRAQVGPALRASGGALTPVVRDAYLTWSEETVRGELRQAHQAVPEDCLAETHGDPVLRDAVFGSVYPPDASILQNYAAVRRQMGGAFMARYRPLAIAIAVAKRTKGVETAEEAQAIGRDYQPGFWVDESLHAPTSDAEKACDLHIANFMAATKAAALDVYQDPALQSRLKNYLTRQAVPAALVGEVRQSVPFGERLKYALVLLHRRPGARDPRPTTVEWLRHLVQIHEATPRATPDANGQPMPWPLFPLDGAPWPLLMPLAHSVPLSEADFMWAAFQGENGADRYHTYGPYRDDVALMPDSLRPSRWFWDAWPDEIVHGGECVPISKSTVNLYSGLGKPAMWAGQPGHSNLISFQRAGGMWTAEVEQDFDGGPEVTSAQWYFDEEPDLMPRFRGLYNWAGAEYQLGLALAMNRGVTSYMDTRIAANIFRTLPDTDRRTLGLKLLRSALAANPFNPELWYRFAAQTPDPTQAAALVGAALAEKPVAPVETAGRQYWQTVAEFVARDGVLNRSPPVAGPDMRRVYVGVKNAPGVTADDLAVYLDRFAATRYGHDDADLSSDRSLAGAGDAYGELRMGQRFRDGDGVAPSDAKAEEFLARSALHGDATASVLLSRLNSYVPTDRIQVTASSVYSPLQPAQHLIDGSGMQGLLHDNATGAETMWQTLDPPQTRPILPGLPASPAWVRFDFARPEKLARFLVWNDNQLNLTDRGLRSIRIFVSSDRAHWRPLPTSTALELPRASGLPDAGPTEIENSAADVPITSVIIAAAMKDGNWGSSCYGLSAVRFVVSH